MIDAVEIINFQSHEYSILEFHPGVNVLKGTSHHGKSAIIRALKWVLFNKPRGEGFKSWFADDKDPTEVAVSFSDDNWVSRRKDSDNRYYSEDLDLKALRTDVPDEIKEITQIKEINFQGQDEQYFLIGDSPGIVGRKLNEIVGLEIIDEVRTGINQKISKLKVEFDIAHDELETTEKRIKEYEHVEKAERLVHRIDKLDETKKGLELKRNKVSQIIDMAQANEKLIRDLLKWLTVEKHYLFVVSQQVELNELKKRHDKIFWLVEDIQNRQTISEEMKEIISLSPEIEDLQKKKRRLQDIKSTASKMFDICSAVRKLEKVRETAKETLRIDLKRSSELKKQLDYCQVCGAERKYWRKSDG